MALPRLNITKYGNIVIGTVAVGLPTNLGPKESYMIQNMSAGKVYWGSDSLVTVANGFPVIPNISIDYGGPLFLIADTAAQDVRYCILY